MKALNTYKINIIGLRKGQMRVQKDNMILREKGNLMNKQPLQDIGNIAVLSQLLLPENNHIVQGQHRVIGHMKDNLDKKDMHQPTNASEHKWQAKVQNTNHQEIVPIGPQKALEAMDGKQVLTGMEEAKDPIGTSHHGIALKEREKATARTANLTGKVVIGNNRQNGARGKRVGHRSHHENHQERDIYKTKERENIKAEKENS